MGLNDNGLTGLQRAFIDHYVRCLNAVQAAKLAGYKAENYSTFGVIGHENLKKPKIREEIDRRLAERAASANEVIARWTDFSRGDLGDFSEITTLDQLADHPLSHVIKKIEFDGVRIAKIELEDRKQALENLSKLHKIADNPADDAMNALKKWIETQL